MKPVCIRSLCIGTGLPKICVPLVGRTRYEVLEEATKIKDMPVDIVEWRIDYFNDIFNFEVLSDTLQVVRDVVEDLPIIATFRKKNEGGEKDITEEQYVSLYEYMIHTGYIDVIDIALITKKGEIEKLVDLTHEHAMKLIISEHDFFKTPTMTTIIKRCKYMQSLQADMVKIAYMPQSVSDLFAQLQAVYQLHLEGFSSPIISVSMGELGAVSRIGGELFSSSVTFASGKHASAPGQLCAKDVDAIQKEIHSYMY